MKAIFLLIKIIFNLIKAIVFFFINIFVSLFMNIVLLFKRKSVSFDEEKLSELNEKYNN